MTMHIPSSCTRVQYVIIYIALMVHDYTTLLGIIDGLLYYVLYWSAPLFWHATKSGLSRVEAFNTKKTKKTEQDRYATEFCSELPKGILV